MFFYVISTLAGRKHKMVPVPPTVYWQLYIVLVHSTRAVSLSLSKFNRIEISWGCSHTHKVASFCLFLNSATFVRDSHRQFQWRTSLLTVVSLQQFLGVSSPSIMWFHSAPLFFYLKSLVVTMGRSGAVLFNKLGSS